jgi:hypothetical protein
MRNAHKILIKNLQERPTQRHYNNNKTDPRQKGYKVRVDSSGTG